MSTAALVVSVVVTLLVYWLAEEYAEVVGEQVEGGRLPSRASVRRALAATWPMVTASYVPLLGAGAGLAGRGLRPHGRQRGTSRSGHPADTSRVAGRSSCPVAPLAALLRYCHCGRPRDSDDSAQGPRPDPPALKIGASRTRLRYLAAHHPGTLREMAFTRPSVASVTHRCRLRFRWRLRLCPP